MILLLWKYLPEHQNSGDSRNYCPSPRLLASSVPFVTPVSDPQAAIRKELNEYKSNEMEVHASSKHLTRWASARRHCWCLSRLPQSRREGQSPAHLGAPGPGALRRAGGDMRLRGVQGSAGRRSWVCRVRSSCARQRIGLKAGNRTYL